jgi:3-oxoacyl-ACP reductase-like protein
MIVPRLRLAEHEVAPGVTPAALAECCRVLNTLSAHMDLVTSGPELKLLRKSLIPFVQAESAKRFGGRSKEENDLRRKAAQESNRVQQQAKARDRKFIENTLLRAGRRAKLDALKEATDDERMLLLVPDGLGAGAPVHAALPAPDMNSGQQQHGASEGPSEERGKWQAAAHDKPQTLENPRACYTCKVRFTQLHFFYDQLCPKCAELNYRKRLQTADLSGKVAVLTGARVKIGFRVALKLLRCGATLIATSRFPRDAAERFAQEHDYGAWEDRLHVVGLDLRDLVGLEHFTEFIQKRFGKLDIIINNACQTVRRVRADLRLPHGPSTPPDLLCYKPP